MRRWLALTYYLLTAFIAVAQVPSTPFGGARSAFGPSLAVAADGTVFAAWRGAGSPDGSDDDQHLYIATRREGKWTAPITLPVKSMFSPALAAHGDTVFIAWHGPGNLFTGTGDARIFFGSYNEKRGFRELGAIPKAASAGPPSLAMYQGRLYGAWRGLGNITMGMVRGNEHWILYATCDVETQTWSSAEGSLFSIVHANSTSGPALATVGDKLYAVWRGTGSLTFDGPNRDPGDPLIYYASFDGNTWSAKTLPLTTIPGAETAWGAAAAEWNGRLCAGWRGNQPWDGARGDQSVYFAVLDPENGWQRLNVFGASIPLSAFGPAMASGPAKNEIWIGFRGEFNSTRNIDDQSIYVLSLKPTSPKSQDYKSQFPTNSQIPVSKEGESGRGQQF